jgi:tetratricopeptide (TPR) repeat protein
VRLCALELCPPSVRYQVASRHDRLREPPFDGSLDVRLNDPAANFKDNWRYLRQQLAEAQTDTNLACNAYRTFSHGVRGTPALVAVAWEAEEEALTLYPPGTRGRYHVLLARALTLQAMKRSVEAAPLMDEAVRLCADLPPEVLADTMFWAAGMPFGEGRIAESLEKMKAAIAVLELAGKPPPNGWWYMHVATCLQKLGRHAEAFDAITTARRSADPGPVWSDALLAEIEASLRR